MESQIIKAGKPESDPTRHALGVWSRSVVGWIDSEAIWLRCPDFADVFVGRQALQCLQAARVIVCRDEVIDVRLQLAG